MSARLLASVFAASALATLAFAACSDDEALSPIGADAGVTADAGSDAGENPMDASTPGDAGTVKRTVTTRNPMGDVPNNYFVDGDFELSSDQDQEQYGWYAVDLTTGGQLIPALIETGGLCRTGLRCAIFEKDQAFFLRGAAAKGKGNVVSVWAKLPGTHQCKDVKSVLVGCDTLTGAFGQLKSDAAAPDTNGWCHYSETIGTSAAALCLYMTNTLAAGEEAVVDSAVLGPDDGTVHAKPAETFVPDAATMSGLEAVAHAVKTKPRPKTRQRFRAE